MLVGVWLRWEPHGTLWPESFPAAPLAQSPPVQILPPSFFFFNYATKFVCVACRVTSDDSVCINFRYERRNQKKKNNWGDIWYHCVADDFRIPKISVVALWEPPVHSETARKLSSLYFSMFNPNFSEIALFGGNLGKSGIVKFNFSTNWVIRAWSKDLNRDHSVLHNIRLSLFYFWYMGYACCWSRYSFLGKTSRWMIWDHSL